MNKCWLVSPYLFVGCYIGYVILGVIMFSLVEDQFSMYKETFLYIGVGLVSYIAGCQIVLPDKKRLYLFLTLAVLAFYGFQEYNYVGLAIPVVGFAALQLIERLSVKWFLLLGISLLIIQLAIGGIPLVDSELRKTATTPLFILGYSFVFLGMAFMAETWDIRAVLVTFAGCIGLLSLFTFRVYVIELVIVVFVTLYALQRVKLVHVVSSGIPLLFLILFLGYMGVRYQQWKFNPFELFFFRPAFTFGVLNEIAHETGYLGITHGEIWLQFSSATIIGPYLFGYESNITSTIMGPLIFDGGIFELSVMALLGASANTLYKKAANNDSMVPYYAILLAFFLVGIDVSSIPSIFLLVVVGLYLVSKPGT